MSILRTDSEMLNRSIEMRDPYNLVSHQERGLLLSLLHLRGAIDLSDFRAEMTRRASHYLLENEVADALLLRCGNESIIQIAEGLAMDKLCERVRENTFVLTKSGWFWSNWTIEYLSQITGGSLSYVLTSLRINENFELHQAVDVLDIGCGCGVTALGLTSIFNDMGMCLRSYKGIDVEAGNINVANQVFFGGGCSFEQYDANEGMPELEIKYDLIVCRGVLLYINPKSFFDQVRHKLKPGGMLFVQTPSWPHFFHQIFTSIRILSFRGIMTGLVAFANQPRMNTGERLFNKYPWSPSLRSIESYALKAGLQNISSGHIKNVPYANCGSVLGMLLKNGSS